MPHKELRRLRNTESKMAFLREEHTVSQYQVIGPENTHVSDITDSEHIIFRNMYVYKYTNMQAITIKKRLWI